MIFGAPSAFGDFQSCKTQDDLAAAFGTTPSQFQFHLYDKNAPTYKTFTIPKASGSDRLIAVPPYYRMVWQEALSKYLTEIYVRKRSVHGFVRGGSICTNATIHVKRNLILNVDLNDFFPSIHYGRVRGLFSKYPFGFTHEVASTLAQLCTFRKQLPQGAPTSPLISNLICRSLDNDLWNLARRCKCIYTRYADDITFSTDAASFHTSIVEGYDDWLRVVELGKGLRKVIAEANFSINFKKVRLRKCAERQEVTGLVCEPKG